MFSTYKFDTMSIFIYTVIHIHHGPYLGFVPLGSQNQNNDERIVRLTDHLHRHGGVAGRLECSESRGCDFKSQVRTRSVIITV